MTPKFLTLHRLRDDSVVLVNPRRVNTFHRVPPPTQQPDIYVGTELWFGSGWVVVKETPEDIVRLLSK